ncbi:hypothetical protein D3C80_763760 [compost metagenome]
MATSRRLLIVDVSVHITQRARRISRSSRSLDFHLDDRNLKSSSISSDRSLTHSDQKRSRCVLGMAKSTPCKKSMSNGCARAALVLRSLLKANCANRFDSCIAHANRSTVSRLICRGSDCAVNNRAFMTRFSSNKSCQSWRRPRCCGYRPTRARNTS